MRTVFTLTLWIGCLTAGLIGFALPYPRPQPLPEKSGMPPVEMLELELSGEPLPSPREPAAPPPDLLEPPPLLDPLAPPEAPPLIEVAEPSLAIAFPLPVEGAVRVVEAKQASHARAQTGPAPKPPIVHALTYGQGEGRQPAPDYPRPAIRGGQEGTVTVRFSVGANGKVLSAEAVTPSPWPLLNEAALRAIRDRWRFPSGGVRLYEVSIRFALTQ